MTGGIPLGTVHHRNHGGLMPTITIVRNMRITGLVQGVGFRDALTEEAKRLGLAGWCRNRSDGSVEAVVAGTDQEVRAVIAWAHRGPPNGRVDGVVVTELTSPGPIAGRFEKRETV